MMNNKENGAEDDTVPILDETTSNSSVLGLPWRMWAIIIPVVTGYYLSLGFSAYIIPEYVHKIIDEDYKYSNVNLTNDNFTYNACVDNKSGPGYEKYKYVQQETAKWQNYFSVARVTPAIFATLIWASYSDVVGRKMLLLVAMSGTLVKLLIISLVAQFRGHFAFLVMGEIAEGISGTFTTYIAVMFALVADLTEAGRQRTIAIVLSELLLGMMYAMSSFVAGYYIQYAGFFPPSITAFCCLLASFLITYFFLSETLHERKPGGIHTLIARLSTAFKLYFKPESRLIQIKYFLLLFSFIFYTIQGLNRGSLETLYQLGQPFCWSAEKIGWFGAARVVMLSLVGMSGVFLLKKCLADDTIAVVSCMVTAISYVVEGLAETVEVLYTGKTEWHRST